MQYKWYLNNSFKFNRVTKDFKVCDIHLIKHIGIPYQEPTATSNNYYYQKEFDYKDDY